MLGEGVRGEGADFPSLSPSLALSPMVFFRLSSSSPHKHEPKTKITQKLLATQGITGEFALIPSTT